MPCPHFNIKIIQRSKRQSAVAAAAYQSGEGLFSEYDQKRKYYSKQKEVVHAEILLPGNAPPGYADRQTLWNAVEAVECQWNSQLARRFIMALPRELSHDEQIRLMREYCREQFVSRGIICDFAIHDKGDGNPHAHLLLTLRPMDEQGRWLPKCHKEYVLDENGQRIRLKSGEWKSRRVNTVDWNDRKYGEVWRHEWEVLQNRFLEMAGRPERVDLRSFERQNNPHAPQVHLGTEAAAMERKGVKTNLGNLNREIVSANRLYDAIRSVVKSLRGWLEELSEKLKTENEQDEQNLAAVLSDYLSLRKDGRSEWSRAGQTKAQVNDLKQMSAAIVFLQQNGITTVQKLGEHLNAASAKASDLRSRVKANDRRIRDIDAIIEAAAVVRELQPLHDQYVKICWKSKKEKFAADHADDLRKYNKAFRLLKKFGVVLPLDAKPLRAEQKELQKFNQERCVWELTKAECQFFRSVVNEDIARVAGFMKDRASWEGTASELLEQIPVITLRANKLKQLLNVSVSVLYNEYGIIYLPNQRSNTRKTFTLLHEPEPAKSDDVTVGDDKSGTPADTGTSSQAE